MYIPPKFKIEDSEDICHFIDENSFGLLLSIEDGYIHDTHTPFIISEDKKKLLGHVARANFQWDSWQENEVVKVIFSGPHTYISPRYYISEFAVPTWNYTVVSVSGRVSLIEDIESKLNFLDKLTATHEVSDDPWTLDRSDDRYIKLLSGLVVFSVEIETIEASFKMNQNKNIDDQRKVVASLIKTGCPYDHDVAGIMEKNMKQSELDIEEKS